MKKTLFITTSIILLTSCGGGGGAKAEKIKDDDCTDGKIAGALLGGGVGGAISRKEGRWWAVPLGAVTGAAIGCQVDGG